MVLPLLLRLVAGGRSPCRPHRRYRPGQERLGRSAGPWSWSAPCGRCSSSAALILARAWGIDLGDIAMGETCFTRAVRAASASSSCSGRPTSLEARPDADRQPAGRSPRTDEETAPSTTARRQARSGCARCCRSCAIHPVVVLAVIAVLMALSALGVQIGPLIAGAGVVGIAIGFGAQTLVQGHHPRHLLPARRRLPRRRVHPERQLQGHGRDLLAALGEAAAPPRADLHRALRRARRGAEP